MNRPSIMLAAAAIVCAACGRGPSNESPGHAASVEKQGAKAQLVISPEQQAIGGIEAQPAVMEQAPEVLRVSGRIARADDRTWRVGVRTDGLVVSVAANLGDAVQKGQVLARYHADEVREERAKYRVAVSELARAEAGVAQAQRALDRVQTLLTLKAASVVQVEQARQDLLTAQTAERNARIEVDRGKDVLEDDLRVPLDPAAGDETADQVPILAPAAGYVVEKNVTPGRTIAPGTDAFVIADLSEVWMLASVRQDQLERVQVGQAATVTLAGTDSEPYTGRIVSLGQEMDPITRVMPVRIVLSNPRRKLRPEMLANAEIPVARATAVVTVSSDAVQQVNGQDVVFIKTGADRFALRAVRVGSTSGGKTPILDGIMPGEQVVVRGSFTLKGQLLRASIEE
jgi:cobalt-zinc-cadmium efflux system membrane fusion protein